MEVKASVEWVRPGLLARSARPGYGQGPLSRAHVNDWVYAVRELGIKSIICLMASGLEPYKKLLEREGGLLDFYRQREFEVYHVPVKDHKTPPLTKAELDRVAEVFAKTPKPALIHCSAGYDRTGAAVAHIAAQHLLD